MIKKIFYSYSHKDKEYLQELQKYLKPAIKDYNIEEFVDKNINSGENINKKIMENIEESDLIILLLSASYLASNSCEKELDIALNTNKAFPVILESCDWKNNNKLREIKVLPNDGCPINKHTDRQK